MSKRKTINATAEHGIGVEDGDNGSLILVAESSKHKVRVRIKDHQMVTMAYEMHRHLAKREKELQRIRQALLNQV